MFTMFRYSNQFSWREERRDEVEEEEEEEEEEVPESFRVKMVGVVGGRRKEARVRVDKDSGIFTSCGSAEGSSGEEGSRGSVEREAKPGVEEERNPKRQGLAGEKDFVMQESREVEDAKLENRETAFREDEESSMKSRKGFEKRPVKRDDLNESRMIRWDGEQRAAKVDMRDLVVSRGRPDDKILMVREGRQVFREPSAVKFKEIFGPKSGGKSMNQESRKPCTCLHHPPAQNVAAAPQRKARQTGERRGVSLERGLEERRRRRLEEERRREKEALRGREREGRRKKC